MVDVEGDNGHGGGKGDEADGDAVVESCKLQSEILEKMHIAHLDLHKIFLRTSKRSRISDALLCNFFQQNTI